MTDSFFSSLGLFGAIIGGLGLIVYLLAKGKDDGFPTALMAVAVLGNGAFAITRYAGFAQTGWPLIVAQITALTSGGVFLVIVYRRWREGNLSRRD
ncbi:hypothetical protein [Gemmatimonas sp.]|jgi:hypothetical protein|uniref:hypothetical protein n=1 Tax=Gemmatimonas sp. TaxID=1962908 RepID=UPI003DA21A1D